MYWTAACYSAIHSGLKHHKQRSCPISGKPALHLSGDICQRLILKARKMRRRTGYAISGFELIDRYANSISIIVNDWLYAMETDYVI